MGNEKEGQATFRYFPHLCSSKSPEAHLHPALKKAHFNTDSLNALRHTTLGKRGERQMPSRLLHLDGKSLPHPVLPPSFALSSSGEE